MENRVVLVTGGTGYIGSHLCKALKDTGFIPVTYGTASSATAESTLLGSHVIGNLLDKENLEKTLLDYKPTAVIHLASLCNISESIKDPSSYYSTNIIGLLNLLNAMLKHDIKNIIFASSSAAYCLRDIDLFDQSSASTPISPYAMSKYVGEKIIQDFASAYEFKYMILRYFNVAGVDWESGLKRPANSLNFFIPKALLSVIRSDTSLMVFGSDYPTPDGSVIRDYIHIKDLTRAHILALDHLQKGKNSGVMDLGSGKGTSILEIIDHIKKITNKNVPYVLMPRKAGDLSKLVADLKNSKEILNFEPKLSDLNTIIESEWKSLQYFTQKQ